MASTAATGCGSNVPGDVGAKPEADTLDATADISTGDGAADPNASDATTDADAAIALPVEDFWVLYRRQKLAPASIDDDLVLTAKDNPNAVTNAAEFGMGISPWGGEGKPLQLTPHALQTTGGLTCQLGCVVSNDLKHVAIATGEPTVKGSTYALASLGADLRVAEGKLGELKDVADLHFAGGRLYYAKARNCFNTGKCQYEIWRRLLGGSAGETMLTVMAPDTDPDTMDDHPHTTYSGRFQVSDHGETLVFLTTTIRSVKVWAWRGGSVYLLDSICDHPSDNGACVGMGTQYHDLDSIGISPDGTFAVLMTVVDNGSLQVRRYTIGSGEKPIVSKLVTMSPGVPYLQGVCADDNLASWQHAEVRGRPLFSADGKTLYFLGWSNCAPDQAKVWTDIMSLPVDVIGKTIAQGDITNYTKNPRDNSVDNLSIRELQLSPLTKFFVFNASPRWNQSGAPASASEALSGTVVYVMPAVEGATPLQITNEAGVVTRAPKALVPPAVK